MRREGFFENGVTRPTGALNQLFPLPADVLDGRTKDGLIYPVAIYDHNDGQSVTGEFAYYGRRRRAAREVRFARHRYTPTPEACCGDM
ncbi:MAG: hypothetical protein HY704_02735 [Gemmatimonadetes bacterium]|nr:hypothetical protein [Gemmatimonadota bacterium]